jgi:hypothetical protein
VDIVLHQQLYPPLTPAKNATLAKDGTCIPLSSLSQAHRPSSGFFLLLPSKVMGFSMQTKRWGKTMRHYFRFLKLIKLSSLSQSGLHLAHRLECSSLR